MNNVLRESIVLQTLHISDRYMKVLVWNRERGCRMYNASLAKTRQVFPLFFSMNIHCDDHYKRLYTADNYKAVVKPNGRHALLSLLINYIVIKSHHYQLTQMLFSKYIDALRSMDGNCALLILKFVISVLSDIGFGPQHKYDVIGQPIKCEQLYDMSIGPYGPCAHANACGLYKGRDLIEGSFVKLSAKQKLCLYKTYVTWWQRVVDCTKDRHHLKDLMMTTIPASVI